MRILTVIPISRGISKDTLTYFSKKDVTVGSIVSIPLRQKMVFGLVSESKPAGEMKSELKSLSYSIKKTASIEEGIVKAQDILDSGKALAKLEEFRLVSAKAKPYNPSRIS